MFNAYIELLLKYAEAVSTIKQYNSLSATIQERFTRLEASVDRMLFERDMVLDYLASLGIPTHDNGIELGFYERIRLLREPQAEIGPRITPP